MFHCSCERFKKLLFLAVLSLCYFAQAFFPLRSGEQAALLTSAASGWGAGSRAQAL